MQKGITCITLFIILSGVLFSQSIFDQSSISGNLQFDGQYYYKDSVIGAEDVPDKLLSNGFLFLNYKVSNFSASLRYENYMNPILGIDAQYKGNGIAYRSFGYSSDFIDVTAGNFYEQFGSGILLRSYEERQLGIDNSFDGLNVKIKPVTGLEFKALIGKQRNFWALSEGIVRAADMSISLNDVLGDLFSSDYNISLGGSVVSKMQPDVESFYFLPHNVFAYSSRLALSAESFSVDAEFGYKYNDPSAINNYSFNPGTALVINTALYGDGYGFLLNLHRIDNMNFRSEREAAGNYLTINYIPSITKQHLWRLATLYPYSTQMNGEVGLQADFTYTFPKESFFGGKYGTTVALNYARIQSLDTTQTVMDQKTGDAFRYDSPFFKVGERLHYQDINLEVTKKWDKDIKTTFALINIIYDKDLLEGKSSYGKVNSTIAVLECEYKFNPKNSLRTELQHLWSTQDSALHSPDNINGNWALLFFEYTIAPHWYITAFDEWNYGNEYDEKQIHYLNASVAYIEKSTRISFGYGRQRGGLLCVGGVCREMPASNGFSLSITSTF